MKLYLQLLLVAFVSLAAISCGNSGDADTLSTTPAAQPTVRTGPKNILILSSSRRRGGNSEKLCEQFKLGAESAGHRVEMNDIRYFDQQEYDRKASAALADDAAAIIDRMKRADVIFGGKRPYKRQWSPQPRRY